ncbi:MAG: methyl-accepting chemotaxis protein, partial [Myxococcota bacterium]
MNNLLTETSRLIGATKDGQLDARGDADAFEGGWGKLVSGVNELIDAFVEPINVTAEYVDRISKGDIPEKITAEYKGDFNEIKNNLNACVDLMNNLLTETSRLIGATKDGQLDARGDADAFEGGWGKLVSGVNELIDAFVEPINVTAEYVDRISKGDIPEKITAEYKGDFNEIKNNLNACVDNVGGVVGQMETMVQAVKAGDLTLRGDAGVFERAWAAMISGVNEMMQPIHDGFVQVAEATDQIASASGQVASSSQQVAEGASEQASSLQETSSSLEEMESMAKQNADNSQQARALSVGMKEAADHGTEAMGRMIEAMGEIRESAESTAAIIKDINEIAFQTNLLALNAAVEAARAGDAGRGFAVVAEEVRNLALRAKDAAQRTESLINQSVKLSEQGSEISNGANENLGEIVGSIAKVTDIISEIAAASEEQSRGIEQVNKAVAEMDKVVQTSAANSEESSSASEELSSQAQELAAMVGRFQLSRERRTGRPTVRSHSLARSPSAALTARERPSGSSAIHVKAEELIPLEDDKDLADF